MQDKTGTNACPRCAHENDADTRFCGNCGLRIDGLCPNCGTQNEHSTHHCSNCGHDFAATPQQAASAGDLRGVPSAAHGPYAPQQATPTVQSRGVECPRCHKLNEPGAVFCFNCGLPFDSAAGFEPRAGVGGIPAFAAGRPGGFWIRVVAEFIDGIIVNAAAAVLILLLTDVSPTDYYAGTTELGAADFINLILAVGYAPVGIALYSTTIGKKAFNMYVLRPDGSRVSFWRALGRELAKALSAIPLGAGYLMVAFREDKRGLHDLIADTVVVQR